MIMESYEEQYFRLLSEIEKIARPFLEAQFNSIQEVWQIETDLIKYQIALQEAISNEQAAKLKARSKIAKIVSIKQGNWKPQVQLFDEEIKHTDNRIKVYEHAYQLSRQFGDAIAWALLGDWLIPLTQLPQGPSGPSSDGHRLPSDHGLNGMFAIAEGLCAAGAGFPILHDMTNCLRTGDITFYSLDGNHTTVEIKTHLKDRSEGILSLEVDAHSIYSLTSSNDSDKWNAINDNIPKLPQISLPPEVVNTSRLSHQLDPRLKRQVERMKQAKIWQSMPPNMLFKIGDHDEGIVIHNPLNGNTHHWEIVRELIIKAKADNVASRIVDNAFVYTAVYNDSPLEYPWIQGLVQQDTDTAQLGAESIKACLPSILCPEREMNYIWMVPGSVSPNALPFFLYSLPIDVIMDIMWGRLAISVTVNLGKIVTALEEIGLDARVPSTKEEFASSFLPVSLKTHLADNRTIRIDLHIRPVVAKIIDEFLSLMGFVEQVSELVKVEMEQANHRIGQE